MLLQVLLPWPPLTSSSSFHLRVVSLQRPECLALLWVFSPVGPQPACPSVLPGQHYGAFAQTQKPAGFKFMKERGVSPASGFSPPAETNQIIMWMWLKLFHSLVLQQLVLLSQLAELTAYGALSASQWANLAAQVLFNLPAGLQVCL